LGKPVGGLVIDDEPIVCERLKELFTAEEKVTVTKYG
jgi:hypothetical protein